MFALRISILFVIIGIISCEKESSQPVNSAFELNLPASLTNSFDKAQQFRDSDGVHRLMQEKCQTNGGTNAFNTAKDAILEGYRCYGTIVNEIAQNAGPQPDRVASFKRVCSKASQLEGCFDGVVAGIRPCLTANETHYLVDAKTAFHELLEFACANDAEKITEFLSENSTNCRTSHRHELERCVYDSADPIHIFYFSTIDATPDTYLQRLFSAERCGKVYDAKSCVVNVLRQCENAVSADFLDSALDIIIRGTPCKDHIHELLVQPKPSGATRSFLGLSRSSPKVGR